MNVSGHLEVIKKTSWLWFESKFVILAARMVFISIHVYVLLLIYEVYRNGLDLTFVLSYGANAFAYVFYFIISFTYITQRKTIASIEQYMKENFRPFSSRGKNIKRIITKRMKLGKYVSYTQIFLSVTSLITLLPINSDRSGIMYIKMMSKRAQLPQILDDIHSIHFYVVHYFAFQTTYCYSNVMLFFILHLNFQYIIMIEDCRRLEDGLDPKNYSVRDQNEYHRNIEKRLASILNHYQIVCRYQIYLEKLFRRPMFFVVWTGLIALMFVSYLLVEVDLGPDIFLVFIVWLSIIEIALHFVVYGQFFADQREDLWNVLMNCQWLNWNSRNRRTYQMFLKHVNQVIKIKPGSLIVLDFTFLIWFGRKTVSAVAFLSTIEELNSTK